MATLPATPFAPAPQSRLRLSSPGWPLLIALAAVAAIAAAWTGYQASDDASYFAGAVAWVTHPPQAGGDHWATRFPLILSLAGMMALFGKTRLAMNLTALLWYALFVVAARWLAGRIAGPRAGWIATLLLATMPVVVGESSTVSCDLTEACFLMLGVGLAGDVAAGEGTAWRPAAGAGVAFGLAILCRETTALALLGFVPLFIAGRPLSRRALIVMGLACLAVIGIEAVYQYALTGDPLNRWTLAFHHDSHIDRAANLEGNLLLWPPIDPLLVLLVNDDFALIFWLAIAAVAFRFDRRLDPAGRRRFAVLLATALAAFLLTGALYTKLVLNPRYFMLPTIAATVAVAAWLDGLRPFPRAALIAGAVAANFAMLAVENHHPRWPSDALLIAAQAHPGAPIRTDAETLHRALVPLAWDGITRASAGAPMPGALLLTEKGTLPAGAAPIARYPAPPTLAGAVIDRIGLAQHLPGAIARRLISPGPTMVLASVPR